MKKRSAGEMLHKIKGLSGKKKILICVIIIAVIALIAFFLYKKSQARHNNADLNTVNTAEVMRGDISNELTSSGTLSPKDTYTITSLVTGEILEANFEEGDQVEKGQVLYVIDKSDITKDVDSASRNLETAKTNYEQAQKDYDDAVRELGGGTVKSTQTGYVKNITIKSGDYAGGGDAAVVGDLYNDSAMTLRVAFLNTDADALSVGQDIVVELSDTGETIPGRIEEKSDLIESINSGTMVKYVKIIVTNPGGLSTSDRAVAYVGDIRSISDNTFEAYQSGQLKVELPSNVKIAKVLVSEGQYVSNGTALFTITADSLTDALNTAKKTLDQAQNSLIDAENNVSAMDDTVDKYTITAPISGQVITKKMKAGDKISNNSNSTNELALIYDLSELTFQMSIDELDISNVKVGQEVKVTADAFDKKTFTGHVTNVGLNGTAQNGVTTYPVVVTLDETDGLLPGMNVDGVIILEKAENTLYVPSGALQRGNIVYVKDDSASKAVNESGSSAASENGGAGSTAVPEKADAPAEEKKAGQDSFLGDAPDGFTAVQVETGIISSSSVEILSGLSEGQEVYVKDTASDSYDFKMMDMDGGPGGGGGAPPDGGGGGPRG